MVAMRYKARDISTAKNSSALSYLLMLCIGPRYGASSRIECGPLFLRAEIGKACHKMEQNGSSETLKYLVCDDTDSPMTLQI